MSVFLYPRMSRPRREFPSRTLLNYLFISVNFLNSFGKFICWHEVYTKHGRAQTSYITFNITRRNHRKINRTLSAILDLQSIPRESNNKDVAAMLVELTREANEEPFVIVHQHGGNDVTCKSRINCIDFHRLAMLIWLLFRLKVTESSFINCSSISNINQLIVIDWYRLISIGIDFDWLTISSIAYAGNRLLLGWVTYSGVASYRNSTFQWVRVCQIFQN